MEIAMMYWVFCVGNIEHPYPSLHKERLGQPPEISKATSNPYKSSAEA